MDQNQTIAVPATAGTAHNHLSRIVRAAAALLTDEQIASWYSRTHGTPIEAAVGTDWSSRREEIVLGMVDPSRDDRLEVVLRPARQRHYAELRDDAFADITVEEGDTRAIPLVEGGFALVDILGVGSVDEAVQERLNTKHNSSDLLRDVPSIRFQLGDQVSYLTWAEAFNVGVALVRTARVAHYG